MLIFGCLMLMTTIYSASAQSAMPPSSSGDTATFDQILQPVWKVYNFVKYIATAIAAIFLVFAGITYMTSGNDMMKRENAKHMIAYVIVGLIVIWAAPFIVQLFAS
jgi:type IV secretory pathway VirB2 component (pilin)